MQGGSGLTPTPLMGALEHQNSTQRRQQQLSGPSVVQYVPDAPGTATGGERDARGRGPTGASLRQANPNMAGWQQAPQRGTGTPGDSQLVFMRKGGQLPLLAQPYAGPYRQTWALALFFQIGSPLILIAWIAIALSLILQIFRFAHRSIALKKTSGLLSLKSTKKLNRSQNNSGSLSLTDFSFAVWAGILKQLYKFF